MELKIKKVGLEEVELSEPVSPTGQYFSIPPAVCIIAVFEFENPVDDSNFAAVLMDTLPRINPRFTSIMDEDENGEKYWKRVELNVEDHIIVPHFAERLSLEDYDEYFADYISDTGMVPFPTTRPLWELHVFKYPTSNAPGTMFFKLHHALGDGYSLMGGVLSCLQRADDPSLALTFPRFRLSPNSDNGLKRLFSRVPQVLTGLRNTVMDFSVSILKSTFLEDAQTSIRSGEVGVEFRPINVTPLTFSLDEVKKIKARLEVGKYVEDKRKINPRTNRPYKKLVYKRVECVKQVPLKKLPQNVLSNLKWWHVDVDTGEAEMVDKEDRSILKVYDPLHLVNLSEADMKILSENPIMYRLDREDQAKEYQAVIEVCRKMNAHTGTHKKD